LGGAENSTKGVGRVSEKDLTVARGEERGFDGSTVSGARPEQRKIKNGQYTNGKRKQGGAAWV